MTSIRPFSVPALRFRAFGVLALCAGVVAAASGQEPAPTTYAITGARIVPVSGAPIENGTIMFAGSVITAVGASISAPADAVVIDGKGLTVYPGLIDLGSTAGLPAAASPASASPASGGPGGQSAPQTTEDVERAKRARLLRPHVTAADTVDPGAPALSRAAAAGITALVATPAGDAIRGQSALVLTAAAPDAPQIGAAADDRRAPLVVRSPVALHVSFAQRPGGGNAYPNSLMGVIAFVRQAFLDAQHDEAARRHAARTKTAPPPPDAALEALQSALARRVPVAFEAETSREILRALDMAKSFGVDPIVTNAREADVVAADLKAIGARVVLSLNYPKRPESLAPDVDEPLGTLRARANAPKTAAALEKAGIAFGFASAGLAEPKAFVTNAAKAVEAGLSRDAALRALTLGAAELAGAADRLGSLQPGKLASLVVTDGDLFDPKTSVKHVFVAGQPVALDAAAGPRRGPNAGRP